MGTAPGDITGLLADVRRGDRDAEARLAEVVYDHLHNLARRSMFNERPDHTLQPTVLVHEAFLRLVRYDNADWTDRRHFFAVAATIMRRILIDHAREVRALKRGQGKKVSLDAVLTISDDVSEDLVALDEALNRLAQLDERQSKIVEMRFFAGLSEEEIARLLDISPRTVKREWQTARAWLHSQMAG